MEKFLLTKVDHAWSPNLSVQNRFSESFPFLKMYTFTYIIYSGSLNVIAFDIFHNFEVDTPGGGGYSTLVWVGVCRWDF